MILQTFAGELWEPHQKRFQLALQLLTDLKPGHHCDPVYDIQNSLGRFSYSVLNFSSSIFAVICFTLSFSRILRFLFCFRS